MYEFIGKHKIGCLMTYIHTVHVVTKAKICYMKSRCCFFCQQSWWKYIYNICLYRKEVWHLVHISQTREQVLSFLITVPIHLHSLSHRNMVFLKHYNMLFLSLRDRRTMFPVCRWEEINPRCLHGSFNFSWILIVPPGTRAELIHDTLWMSASKLYF